ncbi:MAG: hypothetical protein QOF82_87 [Frankiales bacterium]|nr:hypothetical protein [Frankiales bacterium]
MPNRRALASAFGLTILLGAAVGVAAAARAARWAAGMAAPEIPEPIAGGTLQDATR